MKRILADVVEDLCVSNPDGMVTLKTERYGWFWSGRAKFVLGAVKFDFWMSEVLDIEVREHDVAITVRY